MVEKIDFDWTTLVLRITGGNLVRRQFVAPEAGVRPTQDRVREALFSSLCPVLPGARVLDLFAGSGAMGLEAWSRGASQVTWVEGDRMVFKVLEKNVRALCADDGGRGSVVLSDVWAFLERFKAPVPFDIVIADPPYDPGGETKQLEKTLKMLINGSILAPNGLFVYEQGPKEASVVLDGWKLSRDKAYGRSRLLFYRLQ